MIKQSVNLGMTRINGGGAGERVAGRKLIADGFVVQASVPAIGDGWYNVGIAFGAT